MINKSAMLLRSARFLEIGRTQHQGVVRNLRKRALGQQHQPQFSQLSFFSTSSDSKDSDKEAETKPKQTIEADDVKLAADSKQEKEGNSKSFLERFGDLDAEGDSDGKEKANPGSFLERFGNIDLDKESENKLDLKGVEPGSFLKRLGDLDSESKENEGKDQKPKQGSFLERFGNLDDENADSGSDGKKKSGQVQPGDAMTFAKMRQMGSKSKNNDGNREQNSVNSLEIAKEIARLATENPYRPGSIYDPLDLVTHEDKEGPQVRRRFLKRKPKPRRLIQTGMEIHPHNTWFLSRFISPTGKILSRKETGLTAKQQRKVARAIKASRALGLLPTNVNIMEEVEWDRQLEPYVRKTVYSDNEPPYTYKDHTDTETD